MGASWWPRTKLEWAFFSATATQAVVNCSIQMAILLVYLDWVNPPVYEVPLSYIAPLTLAVTTLGFLFQVILTLDAYRIKNNIQLFTQCFCNICLSVSTVMQYDRIKDANSRILVGYNKYKKPFAKNDRRFWEHVSPALIIYLVILKVMPYFFFAFILIYGFINVHYFEPEFSLTMSIMPLALVHIALAVYFVRIETRIGMAIILVSSVPPMTPPWLPLTKYQQPKLFHAAEIAYLVSRIMVLYGNSLLSRTAMKWEMSFYASVALCFSVAATIAGSVCFFSFNKGLKPILLGQVQRKPRVSEWENDYYFQRLNHSVFPLSERESRRFELD
ncbi:hypothetical protein B0J11DRAFT_587651 [Dendryphion nanum]|uniref:Uncharacterized protein n=1 Tax=Dendryphion nanum TaxID=256645 RepID=A0A9P9EJ22_9PLEO|nr:hypothetical protein B0J11DRAFT_587651 [Dendryphion nanum]